MQPHLIWRTWITPVCDLSSHRLVVSSSHVGSSPNDARTSRPTHLRLLAQEQALSCPSFPSGPWCYPKSGAGPDWYWPTHWTSMQTSTDLSSLTPLTPVLNANNSLDFTAWEPEVGPSCCGLDSRCSCPSPLLQLTICCSAKKQCQGGNQLIFSPRLVAVCLLHNSFTETLSEQGHLPWTGGSIQHWLTPSHSSRRPERFEGKRRGRFVHMGDICGDRPSPHRQSVK